MSKKKTLVWLRPNDFPNVVNLCIRKWAISVIGTTALEKVQVSATVTKHEWNGRGDKQKKMVWLRSYEQVLLGDIDPVVAFINRKDEDSDAPVSA